MPPITLSSIDGVPVIAAGLDGPVLAALSFPVGAVNEPLAQRGISHIVEHLALSGLGSRPYQYNGQVSPTTTTFSVQGTPAQVVEFLAHVCHALRDLPLDRFDDEVRILKVEAAGRRTGQVDLDLITRFGAVGPGAVGWREYGLQSTTAAAAQQWADRWFVRFGAVLMTSSPLPDGMTLPLPLGEPAAAAAPREVLLSGRCWLPVDTKLVSVSVVRDSTDIPGGTLGIEAARERAYAALRTRTALSYSVNAIQLPIADRRLLCQLVADGDPSAYASVLEQIASALTDVCEHGPTEEELAFLRERHQLSAQDRGAILSMLSLNASRILRGQGVIQLEEYIDSINAVTPQNVVDILAPSLVAVLAIGPKSLGDALPGWREVSGWSGHRVTGEVFLPRLGRERGTLTIGPDGVTWALHDRACRTVRWDECAAGLCWDNGARRVIGPDGLGVVVHPWAWIDGERLPILVDQYLGAGVRVVMDPGTGPKPPVDTGPPAAASGGRRRLRRLVSNPWLVLSVCAVVLVACVIAGDQYLPSSDESYIWILCVGLGVLSVRSARRVRR